MPCAAQDRSGLPKGLPVGQWILAPSLSTDLRTDSNVSRTESGSTQSDSSVDVGAALEATLPFRQSFFRIGATASHPSYSKIKFSQDYSTNAHTELDLRLSTGDELILRYDGTRDFVRVRDDNREVPDVPEDIYFGEPYDLNRARIELSRAIPGRQGYRVRIERRDYNYKGNNTNVGLYNYRGFDSAYEFRQPVSKTNWLIFYYSSRRFNNYRPTHAVGVPYRREEDDVYQVGWRGEHGKGNAYFARVGYETLNYRFQKSSFRGVSAYYSGSYNLGPRSTINVSLGRQALPSTEDTYYINNVLRASFQTGLLRALRLRGGFRVVLNDYGDEARSGCGGSTREDWVSAAEAELAWPVRPRLEFGVSGAHERRSSNCEGIGYDDTELQAGIRVGWF